MHTIVYVTCDDNIGEVCSEYETSESSASRIPSSAVGWQRFEHWPLIYVLYGENVSIKSSMVMHIF